MSGFSFYRMIFFMLALIVPACPVYAETEAPSVDTAEAFLGKFDNVETPENMQLSSKLVLIDRQEQPFSLETLRGKTVMLNVWATWCPYCVKELPSLLEMKKNHPELEVVLILVDKAVAVKFVQQQVEALGHANLEFYWDRDNVLYSVLGVGAVPCKLIIQPDGRVSRILVGDADWTSKGADAFLKDIAALATP